LGYFCNCIVLSTWTDLGTGYASLSCTLDGYAQLGQMLDCIRSQVQYWDEGDGVELTLKRHRDCWHIKCKQTILHDTKLDHLVNIRGNNVDNDEELIVESDIEPKTSCKIPRLSRSSTSRTADPGNAVCFFCEQSGSNLHQVMTFSIDHKVRQCATVTKDNTLLGKLKTGDMIALEAKYHTSCLLSLYYKAGSM